MKSGAAKIKDFESCVKIVSDCPSSVAKEFFIVGKKHHENITKTYHKAVKSNDKYAVPGISSWHCAIFDPTKIDHQKKIITKLFPRVL